MLFKAYNREFARVYDCRSKLPENAGKYNWICPNCIESLYLIKYKITSEVKYCFLHEQDLNAFIDEIRNYSYSMWTSGVRVNTNNFNEYSPI
ncbi:MAG: hypothetical protein ACFFEY_11845 [Candidatus Thorarchaeota archaeon]